MNINPQFIRFCSVGCLNTLIDAMLFASLHTAGLSVVVANLLSSSTGLLVSLLLNSQYTFKAGRLTLKQISIFFGVTLFGLWVVQPLVIDILIKSDNATHATSWLTQLTGHPIFVINLLSSLSATVVTFMWNYICYSRFVYTKHDTSEY